MFILINQIKIICKIHKKDYNLRDNQDPQEVRLLGEVYGG